MTAVPAGRADYGIDAPNVVRNLAMSGGAALLLAVALMLRWLPAALRLPLGPAALVFPLSQLVWPGAWLAGTACWMYCSSRYGKLSHRNAVLDRIEWQGDERVLDVGCGRGLILVGAAHRVPRGGAVGIDVWHEEDLSGNRARVPGRNAMLEGVAERVRIATADMRHLPFVDSSFDVVTSRAAIHNLYEKQDRARAVSEIARVLKPGGRAVINDIRHFDEYARVFGAYACSEARLLESEVVSALFAIVTFGSLRPNTMLVRKNAAPATT